MSDELDAKSDAELNEIFAVEVAGWIKDSTKMTMYVQWFSPDSDKGHGLMGEALAPTLARAACIALIRAKRKERQ